MNWQSNHRSPSALALLAGLAAALLVAVPVSTQAPRPPAGTVRYGNRLAAAGEVLVKYRTGVTSTDRQQLNQQLGTDDDSAVGGAGVRRVHSRYFTTDTLVNFLRQDPRVLYAEPNYVVEAVATPNDPQFSNLWGMLNTGQTIGCGGSCYGSATGSAGADIGAPAAWDISTGSRDNVVGVVDTGVDYTHPDLAANVWSAPSSFTVTIGGHTITCPAGSHGFRSISGRRSVSMSCDPMDDNNHGSHVSGTIGAVGNNGTGVVGVNWTASIMGLKFLSSSGSGYTSDAINVIEFAIQAKAHFGAAANVRVLSNSWGGGGYSQALADEIAKANANDMLFVAAAGNSAANDDTTAFYPADYAVPNVVAVAATTNKDTLASFSNWGPTRVALGAPGEDILSTVRNGGYAYYSGTSMATPHVSGAAALVLSACPTLDTAALKTTLLDTVDQTLVGWVSSGGRLNVGSAVEACGGTPPPPPPPDFDFSAGPSSRSVVQGTSAVYTVDVSSLNSYAGSVALSVDGLPPGATVDYSSNPIVLSSGSSGSSTLTIHTSTVTPASYPLTIKGTDNTITHTGDVTLDVTPQVSQSFTLSASPSSRRIRRGRGTTYSISIARSGGFTGPVTLSLSGAPSGVTGSFSPNPAAGSSSTLSISTSRSAARGTFTLTVGGVNGALSDSTTVSLQIR